MTHDQDATGDAAVEIVPYDPRWPVKFAQERSTLSAALAPWIVGELEHIGSTAVPGLAAKPIIDIMAPVETLARAAPAIAAAERLGYLYYPYEPEAMHWFCKPSPAFRTHHLHLVPLGSRIWHERLNFRNALREDSKLRHRYEVLKVELARAHRHDREAYTDAKRPFIHEALRRVASDGLADP